MSTDETAALDAIIAELYAVAPADFVAARTRRAKDAEPALARQVAKVRKPVVSAWAVDLLAREGRLADALELGAALREAQGELDAAELARLGRQRRQLVAALARTAVDLAAAAGVSVSAAAQSDLEATLNAALIHADAAAAVATARLAAPLDPSGDVDLADAVSGTVPDAAEGDPASRDLPEDELAERRARREAERAAREAERELERAERDSAKALEQRERAQERADRLRQRVEALRADLERAEREAAEAASELDELGAAASRAAADARTAARRVASAQAALS